MRIHIATGDGQTEYDEAEAWKLWQQENIPQDAKYWKEGMSDWQPLASHFAARGSSINPYASNPYMDSTPAPARGRYAYTKPPHTLTRVVLVMLSLCLVSSVLNLVSDGMQLALLNRPYTVEEGNANDIRQTAIALSWSVLFFATSIPFLMWVYRANVNVRGFGAGRLDITPGWAVGYFFVPFINLVRPYLAMKQLWQASHDPMYWRTQGGTALVGWWWAMWILCNLMGHIASGISRRAITIDTLITSTKLSLVSTATALAVTILAILLVRRISKKQEELVKQDTNQAPPAS